MKSSPPPTIEVQPIVLTTAVSAADTDGRKRSGSLLKVEEVAKDTVEDRLAYPNMNVEWVNRKGETALHLTDRRY